MLPIFFAMDKFDKKGKRIKGNCFAVCIILKFNYAKLNVQKITKGCSLLNGCVGLLDGGYLFKTVCQRLVSA